VIVLWKLHVGRWHTLENPEDRHLDLHVMYERVFRDRVGIHYYICCHALGGQKDRDRFGRIWKQPAPINLSPESHGSITWLTITETGSLPMYRTFQKATFTCVTA
jgi:hypothetical protein